MSPEVKGKQTEFQIIPIEKVTPLVFAQFLKSHEPNLDFSTAEKERELATYSQVLPNLRSSKLRAGISFLRQEELFAKFFTETVINFPNGHSLARYLAKVNSIDWFNPKEEPLPESLQTLSSEYFRRLNLSPLPLRIIKEDWSAFWEAVNLKTVGSRHAKGKMLAQETADGIWEGKSRAVAFKKAREKTPMMTGDFNFYQAYRKVGKTINEIVQKTIRIDSLISARGIVQGSSLESMMVMNPELMRYAVHYVSQQISEGAIWIIAEDKLPKHGFKNGNPYESLVEIYNLGCIPVGSVPVSKRMNIFSNKREFVIFVPPVGQEPLF